jgi:HD-GYP domain-containing protein (c-di-GMP phosphodiesterase class II)
MALVTALEARDIYTLGHSERVTTYSLLIGSRLGLKGPQLKTLELAASLHDIGKIGIRDDILLKNGKLTEAEFEVIKAHPHMGAKILSTMGSLTYISNIILRHHERFDGHGYPQGICGKDIPLEARIIAVADTFDAVTYSRPYRNIPMERTEAEKLLETLAGNQLCPECVHAFLTELNSETLFEHDAFFMPRPPVYELEASIGKRGRLSRPPGSSGI